MTSDDAVRHHNNAVTSSYTVEMAETGACACGCSKPITADSDSPDYASDACFKRFHRNRLGLPAEATSPTPARINIARQLGKPEPVRASVTPWSAIYADD